MDDPEGKAAKARIMTEHDFEAGAREARLRAAENRIREHEERNERRFDKLAMEIDQLKKISYILLATVALTQAPQLITVIKSVL